MADEKDLQQNRGRNPIRAAAAANITCLPLRGKHIIDRRDFLKDVQGNYLLDSNGRKQLNWKCVCGLFSAHSADYRGGEFAFVHDDNEAEQHGAIA